ncbi:MAG TPA: ABC transporter permease subunit, partial [Gemmataceae bacterium]|nr:ABC transporter permease subunit [Gemmataceae bacterium]
MFGHIFRWELRRTVERYWFHGMRVVYALVMLVLFLFALADVQQLLRVADLQSMRLAPSLMPYEYGRYMMMAHFATVFVVAPIFAAGPILREKRQQTMSLLLSTHIWPATIVHEHWLAAWANLLILTSPGIPVLFALDALLDAVWWVGAIWIMGVWILAMALVAFPLLVGVLVRHNFRALTLSYAGNAIIVGMVPLIFGDVSDALWTPPDTDTVFWSKLIAIGFVPTAICLCSASVFLRRYHLPGTLSESSDDVQSGPPIGDDPWYWKQNRVHSGGKLFALRFFPIWLRLVLVGILACVLTLLPIYSQTIAFLIGGAFLFALPVAALVFASALVSSDRESHTWDCLRVSLIHADEFCERSLDAIKYNIRLYWFALIPMLLCVASRQFDFGVVLALCWGIAGGSIHHAAVMGLLLSARSNSTWKSTLIAGTLFVAGMVIIGMPCYVVGLFLSIPAALISQQA